MTDLPAARKNIDLAYGALQPVRLQPEAKAARQHLIAAKNALREPAPVPVPPPTPVPVPPPVVKRVKGAIVVNAGNCSPDLLRQAGISHVAVELNGPNATDFTTSRWDGFTRGWFLVSRGNDGDQIAAADPSALVKFAIIDTESHKADMGGSLAWTETLYAALRSKLGPAFPLYNITFGIHQDPTVVNHDAFRKHNVVPIWESYGSFGETLGVSRTVAKANAEGWNPAHVCIGDKNIPQDVVEMRSLSGLGDVWCWCPEQAAETVLELAKVPL